MRLIHKAIAPTTALLVVIAVPTSLRAAKYAIDPNRSVAIVHVYKSGLFSLFAHDHEIRTPIVRGELDDSESPWVEIWIEAANLLVEDAGTSAKERAEIQKTMEGTKVLDIRQYPKIHFRSTSVEKQRAKHWVVRGELKLHGQTHPMTVEVSEQNGQYQGATKLSQQ